jgi:hypothetical protein
MEDTLLVKLKTHASFKTWTEVPLGTQPNLYEICKVLAVLVQGETHADPYVTRRAFDKSLTPKPKERLQSFLLRVGSDLESIRLTHAIEIQDGDLISRMLEGLAPYKHMEDLFVPWRSGKERLPADYSDFKTLVINHDVAKDPDGRQLPTAYEKSKAVESRSAEPRSQTAATANSKMYEKPSSQQYQKSGCQICGKNGHTAVDCYRRFEKAPEASKVSEPHKGKKSSPRAKGERRGKKVSLVDALNSDDEAETVFSVQTRLSAPKENKFVPTVRKDRANRNTLTASERVSVETLCPVKHRSRRSRRSSQDRSSVDQVICDSGASIHVVINELPLDGPSEAAVPPVIINTANGQTELHQSGKWNAVGKCYLHLDKESQPDAHLFSVPQAVRDGLRVEMNNDSHTMVVTHLDGFVSQFQLQRGLYRTTLSEMHRELESFESNTAEDRSSDSDSDSEDNRDHVKVTTRAMNRRTSATGIGSPQQIGEESGRRENNEPSGPPATIPAKDSNTLGNLTSRKTAAEKLRAIEARQLHCAAGHLSNSVLKAMLSGGKFRGCDLTAKDVDVAEQLLGPCDICAKANFTEPPAKFAAPC